MADLNIEKKKRFPVIWIILGVILIAVLVWYFVGTNDMDVNEETEAELVEPNGIGSGYAEPDVWNGDELTPWDSTFNDNEMWGDESDMPERNDDSNTFGNDYSGAVGTDTNAPENVMVSEKIRDFVEFADSTDANELDRRKTYEGFSKLTMALSAISNAENRDSTSSGQQDLNRLKQQADQLRDERLSQQQAAVIRDFFVDAANVIQNYSRNHEELSDEASQVMDAAQNINASDMASNQKSQINLFFNEAADALQKMEDLADLDTRRDNRNR